MRVSVIGFWKIIWDLESEIWNLFLFIKEVGLLQIRKNNR